MPVLLLCIDGSPAATAASRLALRVAREWNATVHAVFVVEDSGLAEQVDRALDGAGAGERLVAAGEALLSRLAARAAEAGVVLESTVDAGEPFERILEHARAVQPDFIVMGRTGRRGPGRALLGSEVEHVLEFTEWPVIVVPALAGG